jgi:prepilin-type N-terminal cleavage/methylation domain-containing protein
MRKKQRGFTLLEVLVALALVGLSLGVLLGVVSGNKHLALRTKARLSEVNAQRAILSQVEISAHLQGSASLPWELLDAPLQYSPGSVRVLPLRQTQPSNLQLENFVLINEQGEEVVTGQMLHEEIINQ